MYVYYENSLWSLLTPIRGSLFQDLKESNPEHPCEIRETGGGSYLKTKVVEISELEDHSVVRNMFALNRM